MALQYMTQEGLDKLKNKYVFYTMPERKKNAKAEEAKGVQPATVAETPAVQVSDDNAVIAAIIAAITAAREEEGIPSTVSFKVVSFKKRK